MEKESVKQEVDVGVSQASSETSLHASKALLFKIDLYLLPLLTLGFFVLQLDKSNISNAITDTLEQDLNITSDEVNNGSDLLLAGIVISEIPANLILQRLGAGVWLTTLLGIWGVIALAQAWITNLSSFYATRFLLGIFQGGYIPGAMYMLALFYTREELAKRTAVFYCGNYFATAVGSLAAAGLLQLKGINGLAGWQWLFIIEGAITLGIWVLFVLLLPRSPRRTAPIHRAFDLFTPEERQIMQARIAADDSSRTEDKARITWHSFLVAIASPLIWLHCLLNTVSLAPKGGLQLYGPTIIKGLGFSKTKANLLNSVGSFGSGILSLAISFASDKTGLRGPWCIIGFSWSLVFAGTLYGINSGASSAGQWTMYAIFTLLASGNALAQGLNDAWININATSASSRSIGLAFVVMGSNLGGLAGQQLFRSSDAPRYSNAFLAILLLYAASIPITLVLMWAYWRKRKAAIRQQQHQQQGGVDGHNKWFQI